MSFDFTQPHDTEDFFHYSRWIDGKPTYESYQRSTRSIVYQGPVSYYERSDPIGYKLHKLRKSPNYKQIMKKQQELENLENQYESGLLRKTKK